MDHIDIIGAGMAGLLAGGIIRDRPTTIHEISPMVPNNHSAVLRFRTEKVADALDIKFKKVEMLKTIYPWKNKIADALAYSEKCTGKQTLRSIISADGEIQERFVAPENLISTMSDRVNGSFKFNRKIDESFFNFSGANNQIISTIPMPNLMKMLRYKEANSEDFHFSNGFNISFVDSTLEAYCSIYVPNPNFKFNRVSITGSKVIIETSLSGKTIEEVNNYVNSLSFNNVLSYESPLYKRFVEPAAEILGIKHPLPQNVTIDLQRYSKIIPIDNNVRKRFISWATDKHRIYSLGRFATWRPGLLIDDLVNDVKIIRSIIDNGTYDHRKI